MMGWIDICHPVGPQLRHSSISPSSLLQTSSSSPRRDSVFCSPSSSSSSSPPQPRPSSYQNSNRYYYFSHCPAPSEIPQPSQPGRHLPRSPRAMQQQHPQQLQEPRNHPPHLSNGAPRSQSRMAGDPRHRGPLPVPSGPSSSQQQQQQHHLQNGHGGGPVHPGAPPPFDMGRSPPNPPPANPPGKNTKHVPCKFFRQGACQAGPACPFLHSTDNSVETAPCKYFSKGNCKFGAKCALAHILPDGRRVNRPNFGQQPQMGGGGNNLNLGGRVNPQHYHTQDSALANSLLSQQQMNGHGPRYSYPLAAQEEMAMPHGQPQPQHQHQHPSQPPPAHSQAPDGIPIIDAGFVSESGSKYGSPPDEGRLPMSPIGRTALDAPLPASFDSQGISYMARHGPVAASLPSKFGPDQSSSPSQRPGAAPDVLRSLHDTAFGLDSKKPAGGGDLGSSPGVDGGSGSRVMHSQRVARPKMFSASLPRPTVLDEWDDNFTMEEDYLPTNLHDDVLTPQERMRRLSRTEQDSREQGIPQGSSKVGSPLASSPSRFGALFAKQRQKKEEEAQAGLGHVGSPLRESSLQPRSSPSIRPIGSRPSSGDISPFVASPSRQSSMSMISQQLSSTSLHPNSARHGAGGSRLDRAVSSPVSTTRIDEEEQGDLVFSMEEEENSKRTTGPWNRSKSPTTDETSTQ